MITAYFDGACEPINPGGHASYGISIFKGNKEIHCNGVYFDYGQKMSNNVAEYAGCLAILKFLKKNKLNKEKIIIKGDSNLVIQQMSNKWRIKNGLYLQWAKQTKEMLKDFPFIQFKWIPRQENYRCDKLATIALSTLIKKNLTNSKKYGNLYSIRNKGLLACCYS